MTQRRAADLPKLVHLMRGDLDWIVMKALEKDRTRRFETASELAMDVERFLRNEAVEARPPSSVYRLQKLVRRNRTVFVAVGAVAAALVLGLGLSLYLFVQERHALRRALAAEKQQAALREQAERGLEIERGLKAMASVTDKFTEAGRLLSRGEFEKAEAAMAEVQVRFPQSSILWNAMGEGRARRGQWLEALTNYTRSVEADPTNHHAYDCLAVLLLKTGDAEGYRRCRRAILEQFSGTRDPNIAERMAKACLLLPAQGADQAGVLKITGACAGAQTAKNASVSGELVKGLAEYRAGRFVAAVGCLEGVIGREKEPPVAAQASVVLALAQHRQQPSANSRAALTQTADVAAQLKTDGGDWSEALMAQLLGQEAMAAIRNEPAKTNR
jgi:tetratricopeptide (TPR) repeat protein